MTLKWNKQQLYKGMIFTGAALLAAACLPESDSGSIDAGDTPEASFTVTKLSGRVNTYVVQAIEPDVFITTWDFGKGGGNELGTSSDTVYYPFEGDYTIKLQATNANGSSVGEKSVTIEESDPEACKGNLLLLSGCDQGTSKKWHLIQGAGALTVGPPDGGVWWSNNNADATSDQRTCHFNDVVTFFPNGKFTYDDTGDFRVDDEGGQPWPTDIGLGIGCHEMDAIPEKYQAWGSGTFTYDVTATKLTTIGKGAHLGLYKVGEAGTTATPDAKVNYEILELTADKLVIRKMYGWGYWKFVYVPVE